MTLEKICQRLLLHYRTFTFWEQARHVLKFAKVFFLSKNENPWQQPNNPPVDGPISTTHVADNGLSVNLSALWKQGPELSCCLNTDTYFFQGNDSGWLICFSALPPPPTPTLLSYLSLSKNFLAALSLYLSVSFRSLSLSLPVFCCINISPCIHLCIVCLSWNIIQWTVPSVCVRACFA